MTEKDRRKLSHSPRPLLKSLPSINQNVTINKKVRRQTRITSVQEAVAAPIEFRVLKTVAEVWRETMIKEDREGDKKHE